jgi:catechol 2,3-dioxygenase-like lactoylglutathione lyase family enzyme
MKQDRIDTLTATADELSTTMMVSVRHIALMVPDLQEAEQYYQAVFEMELIGREALLEDGLWYTLPFDKSWEDAKAAAIDLGMSALRKGPFVLALFHSEVVGRQIYALGLSMPAEQIARVRVRLPEDAEIMEEGTTHLEFRDPYQVIWQISTPGGEFRTSGDFADRWLLL